MRGRVVVLVVLLAIVAIAVANSKLNSKCVANCGGSEAIKRSDGDECYQDCVARFEDEAEAKKATKVKSDAETNFVPGSTDSSDCVYECGGEEQASDRMFLHCFNMCLMRKNQEKKKRRK